jgi:hypothetical protein
VISLTWNVIKRPENRTSNVNNCTVFYGFRPAHKAEVINAFKNYRAISAFVISDISVYIYGNTEGCVLIVSVTNRAVIALLFLECLTYGERLTCCPETSVTKYQLRCLISQKKEGLTYCNNCSWLRNSKLQGIIRYMLLLVYTTKSYLLAFLRYENCLSAL